MPVPYVWNTEIQKEVALLQRQLDIELLPIENYESVKHYMLHHQIYDVALLEESDFRTYKKELTNENQYTKKQITDRVTALKKVQNYWIQKEYSKLLQELETYNESGQKLVGNVKRFLIRQGIHSLQEVDYQVRHRYEKELRLHKSPAKVMEYLKTFDRLKQTSIRDTERGMSMQKKEWKKYREQIVFLPYHPDQNLAKDFDYVQDKQELIWDFEKMASDTLKRQVYMLLNYILDYVEKGNPKERRVRYLLPLHWLYDFSIEYGIEDLEQMNLNQIQEFQNRVSKKVVNVHNTMEIIDNCRKILFVNAKEIHWHANVWYMERFHFSTDRINPSSPVQRLNFLGVENYQNLRILKGYAQYLVGISNLTIGNIRGILYDVKKFLKYFPETEMSQINSCQIDQYLRELRDTKIQDETYNTNVMNLAKFYRYLMVKEIIEDIPFQPDYYLVKTYPVHWNRSVEEDIYLEILYKLQFYPEIPRLIFLHLWCTGLRISEVCTLKGGSYYWDGEDAWIKIYQIKMKADKLIPIPLVLYRIMQLYISKYHVRADEYLFKAESGGAYRVASFYKIFKNHCKINQIGNGNYIFRSHDYRHTLATRFYDAGVSLQTIRDYLGHETEDMTKQYIDYMPRALEEANERYFEKSGNDLAAAIKVKKRNKKDA